MSILSSSDPGRAHGVSTGDEMPDPWRGQASCLVVDPELFFPIGNTGPALLQVEEAKAICAGCPVRSECLERHLGEPYGVFGGLSEEERRAELRRRSRRVRRSGGAGVAA